MVVVVVLLGMKIFSALKFNPLVSFPRLIAGNLGDFDFGEIGGGAEVGGGVGGGGGGGGDIGDIFLSELRLSRLGTRLQVG